MTGTLRHLEANERDALTNLCDRLSRALGNALLEVWLFGSKARGDFGPESDIDVLIVVAQHEAWSRRSVHEAAADCSLEHDTLLNTHIIDQARWEQEKRFHGTLWREVMRDGVLLTFQSAAV